MQHTPQSTQEIQASADSAATTAAEGNTQTQATRTNQEVVIWTPRFIVSSFIILMVGLGLASLIAYTWANSPFIQTQRLFLLYAIISLVCWVTAFFTSHTLWIRIGCVGMVLWSFFNGLFNFYSLNGIYTHPLVIPQFYFAIACSLFIGSLALSFAYTRGGRWDTLMSWLMGILILLYLALNALHVPPENSHMLFIESKLNTVAMFMTIFVWWFRPANWRLQPGLTFTFGLCGLISYIIWHANTVSQNTIFFQQVVYLLFILSALRTIQHQRRLLQQQRSPKEATVSTGTPQVTPAS